MNSRVLELSKSFDIPKKYWNTIHISGEQHTYERSKPAPYLKMAMQIAKELNLNRVVEIGATRFAITDKCVDYFFGKSDPFVSPPCCNDGHGGIFWALNGFETYSVDIDQNCKTQAIWSFENIKKEFPTNLNLHIPQDGIKFLEEFDKEIEILFLDGWDVGTDQYREKHLEAFYTAKNKLSKTHLILIDDTDFEIGAEGKDYLLSPELLKLGYTMLFDGRQKLFINNASQLEAKATYGVNESKSTPINLLQNKNKIKTNEFKMVEPLKSNRWIILFNNDVEVPEYLFDRYKIKNEGGDLVLTTRMFNTVHYSFNPADLFKITEVTIKYLDPIGEVVNGLVLPIKGSNVEIKCSYKDDNLMFTNFRFIIDVEKMSPLYKNNIETTDNGTERNG